MRDDVLTKLVHRPRRRRRLMVTLAAAALVAAGAWFLVGRGKATEPAYRTAPVARRRLVVRVDAPGTLEAIDPVGVIAPVAGRVDFVAVEEGAAVEAGALLATIAVDDPDSETKRADADVRQARARLADATATRQAAESGLDRASRMQRAGLASVEQLEVATVEARRARAAEAAASAAVEGVSAVAGAANGRARRTQLRAPVAGIVLRREVAPGAAVRADGAPLFAIATTLDRLRLVAEIDEADVAAVRPTTSVTFTVPAWPRRSFEGTLGRIRRVPTKSTAGTSYAGIVDVADPDHALRPGMSASATFVVAVREDALVVPEAALRFSPGGDEVSRARVFVLDGHRLKAIAVEPGLSDGVSTEIHGALEPGVPVVVGVASAKKRNGIDLGVSR